MSRKKLFFVYVDFEYENGEVDHGFIPVFATSREEAKEKVIKELEEHEDKIFDPYWPGWFPKVRIYKIQGVRALIMEKS